MSIRIKILLYLAAILAFFFVALLLIVRTLLLNSFEALEQQTMQHNLEQAQNVLQNEINNLSLTVADWSYWDETYQYTVGEGEGYADNFSDGAFSNIQINLVAITDAEGRIRIAKAYDLAESKPLSISGDIGSYILNGPQVSDFSDDQLASDISGLMTLDNHLMIVVSRAILPGTLDGSPGGVFTFGRFLDDARVANLADSLRLSLQIYPYHEASLPEDVTSVLPKLTGAVSSFTQPLNTSQIAGYSLLNDIDGQPVAILRVETARDTLAQGQYTAAMMTRLLVFTMVAVSVVMLLALETIVLRRVTKLRQEVTLIQSSAQQTGRVTVASNDEVTALSRDINGMLDRLSESENRLKVQNEELAHAYEQAQESTRLKSQFLSTMSHELRTPLNAITGYAGIMLAGVSGELDAEGSRMVSRIYESSEHLLTLVNDILDLAKIEAGRMEVIDGEYSIRALVQSTVSQLSVLAEQKQVRFETHVDEDVPEVLIGDYDRILQIVINLLSNAFKFTEEGSVSLLVSRTQDRLKIQVRDTGIGVPPHALNTIFEEFRQVDGTSKRAYGGTGLGLAIVSKLTQSMGGKITVESTVNQGSTFTVSLPLKMALAAQLTPA
jgi:signal transduction histidine kinase